jgi:hypothetical protein
MGKKLPHVANNLETHLQNVIQPLSCLVFPLPRPEVFQCRVTSVAKKGNTNANAMTVNI